MLRHEANYDGSFREESIPCRPASGASLKTGGRGSGDLRRFALCAGKFVEKFVERLRDAKSDGSFTQQSCTAAKLRYVPLAPRTKAPDGKSPDQGQSPGFLGWRVLSVTSLPNCRMLWTLPWRLPVLHVIM